MIQSYLYGLLAMTILAVLIWLVSVKQQNASIVDSVWSLFFLLGSIVYLWPNEMITFQQIILLSLVAIWALRLSLYITWRNHGKPEDSRYQAIRAKYSPGFALKSLFIIFIFQALLAGFISLPLWFVFTHASDFGLVSSLAVMLWIAGMFFESVGDAQMAGFKKSNASRIGGVMDRGLWRYTRHPNYFGEFCIWWAYYFFAVSAGGWWTLPAPIVMSWLLLKFSGVALLESEIVHRRPAYRSYMQNTSAFFPWPPKKNTSVVDASEEVS